VQVQPTLDAGQPKRPVRPRLRCTATGLAAAAASAASSAGQFGSAAAAVDAGLGMWPVSSSVGMGFRGQERTDPHQGERGRVDLGEAFRAQTDHGDQRMRVAFRRVRVQQFRRVGAEQVQEPVHRHARFGQKS
jgi:hypothetical protein